jgi:hypothetical protein
MADISLIQEKVKLLPEPTQQQVLDFVDYLLQRSRQEDLLWSKLSSCYGGRCGTWKTKNGRNTTPKI